MIVKSQQNRIELVTRPGQLANLDLPLDQRVGVGVAVNAEQQEPLPLLVITIVGIQNLPKQNRNSNELEG